MYDDRLMNGYSQLNPFIRLTSFKVPMAWLWIYIPLPASRQNSSELLPSWLQMHKRHCEDQVCLKPRGRRPIEYISSFLHSLNILQLGSLRIKDEQAIIFYFYSILVSKFIHKILDDLNIFSFYFCSIFRRMGFWGFGVLGFWV